MARRAAGLCSARRRKTARPALRPADFAKTWALDQRFVPALAPAERRRKLDAWCEAIGRLTKHRA
jgi:hypothetical protein